MRPDVLIVSDRQNRGLDLADAVRMFARSRNVTTNEIGIDINSILGVILDAPLKSRQTRHWLRDFGARSSRRQVPMIFLHRSDGEVDLREANKLGATACLSAFTDPASVVTALFRQIAPEKTLTDLLVEHSVDRAGALFLKMFSSARTGRIDLRAIDQEVDPVLRALQQGGLRRWLDVVQAHDDMTARHCLLVAGLAGNFAVYLGLSTADRTKLLQAALVHDVGKSQIPLEILNKPGRLEPDEMAVMRTHAAAGFEILKKSGMTDQLTLTATLYHHEMLDGSGYPEQLRGSQIGDFVRLLTICDIYAALTEQRPYRAPMTQAEALKILSDMTPLKLDAALVDSFVRSLSYDCFMNLKSDEAHYVGYVSHQVRPGYGQSD